MKRRLVLLIIFFVCQLASILASLWMLAAVIFGSRRAWTLAKSYDQLGNVVAGGHEDELFSSRCYRCCDRLPYTVLRRWIDALFLSAFGEQDHCRQAYLGEQRHAL